MRKPINYFGKSWREIQALRAERKREIFWEGVEKRFEENRKTWHDYCVRTNAEYDALMNKTEELMETSKKLSQQVTSKLG